MEQEAKDLMERMDALENDFQEIRQSVNSSCNKLIDSIENFSQDVRHIETAFDEMTKLKREDYVFILFCAGLQACRQYLITDFKQRLSDKNAAKEVKGDKEEKSNRNKSRYYCSVEKIVTNPVPFDAIEHNKKVHPGLAGINHRIRCLGHYPELGYVFGTANIMTSTVTTKEGLSHIQTFHVTTEPITRIYHYKKTGETKTQTRVIDYIDSKAHTDKMFEHCYTRIKNNPKEGLLALVTALAKEHEHLRSDEKTSQSLPFPLLSFTPQIAEHLREYGLDYINIKTIAKQSAYSGFVNLIIEIIYYAYHIGKQVSKAKQANDICIDNTIKVRLRKIINVANVIATSTNLGVVLLGVFTSNINLIRKFDIGGEIVTLYNLSKSPDFMIKVKEEYIKTEISKLNATI